MEKIEKCVKKEVSTDIISINNSGYNMDYFFSYWFRAVASSKSNLIFCLRNKDVSIFLGFNYKQNVFGVFSELLKK